MFQNFKATSSPQQAQPRVTALRAALKEAGFDGFLVPRADAHQSEYVAPCDARLAWLTGFTGSAGIALIEHDRAAVLTDGRYRLQVRSQCDDKIFAFPDWPEHSLANWIQEGSSKHIAFDPWLHTVSEIKNLRAELQPHGKELISAHNFIDKIWSDRPKQPAGKAIEQPIELTGKLAGEKIQEIACMIEQANCSAAVVTLSDSICWLCNLRGSDISHTPIIQAFAIIHSDARVELYSATEKFDDLAQNPSIKISPWEAFEAALSELNGTVWLDPDTAPHAIKSLLANADIYAQSDPCILPKACKTNAEIEGTRQAHLRDALAMTEFLTWLDQENPDDLTEIDVICQLEEFRRATGSLKDISFETICGSGPNGAIIHYRVTEETNRKLKEGELLLVDSGGQYQDGTTDITRTMSIGDPKADERAAYTAVLQGLIAISTARFPKGISGSHLDALARAPLWRMGRDYDHGTGHGVGSYLNVHEGPQRLSRVSHQPLMEGMILSNEPGYYKPGAYGIRLENLIFVQPAKNITGADDREMLEFETLTFVPFCKNLILIDELAPFEQEWVDTYHSQIWDKLSPYLSEGAKAWLKEATQEL